MKSEKRSNIRWWVLAVLAFLVLGCASTAAADTAESTTIICGIHDSKGPDRAAVSVAQILIEISEDAERKGSKSGVTPQMTDAVKRLMMCALKYKATTSEAITNVCETTRSDADALTGFYAEAVRLAKLGMCSGLLTETR